MKKETKDGKEDSEWKERVSMKENNKDDKK